MGRSSSHHQGQHQHPSSSRQGYSERAEWLSGLRQLRTRIATLERDCYAVPRGVTEGVRKDLDELHHGLGLDENDRSHFQLQAKIDLRKLRKKLSDAQSMVTKLQQGQTNPSTLQAALENIEKEMLDFKLSRREEYEDLVAEERALSRELTAFLNRFESWSKEGAPLSKVPPSSSSTFGAAAAASATSRAALMKGPETDDDNAADEEEERGAVEEGMDEKDALEAQVEAIDRKIVKEGGPTGGWHPKEHEIFMGLWTQVRGVTAPSSTLSSTMVAQTEEMINESMLNDLLDRAAMVLRERSESEVAEHLRWYMRYLRMGAEKRRLIHQWRALKDKEREEMVKREAELEAQMNPLLRPKTASVVANLTNKEKENLRKKQMVEEWREKKAQEAAQKHAEEKRKKDQVERQREERERKEMARKKQQVEMYKIEKEEEKRRLAEMERKKEEAERKREVDEWVSHVDLNARTRETIEKAKQKREEIASKALERRQEERYEKQKKILEVAASEPIPEGGHRHTPRYVYRDPDRLIRPTTASKVREYTDEELEEKERRRQHAGAHEKPMAMMARDLQFMGRAKPDWCRNVV